MLSGLNLAGGEISGADLTRADLSGANLSWANLAEIALECTNLGRVDLCRADLSKAILKHVTLARADLSRVDLRGATLDGVDLSEAILLYTDFRGATFSSVTFQAAILNKANLSGVDLRKTNFEKADLSQTNLRGANLSGANLSAADLTDADLSHTYLGYTNFTHVDLRSVKGLETALHLAPSEISLSTLVRSQGQLPEQFLRNAGVPAALIEYIHTLATNPIHYSSCAICYAPEDENIARQLSEDLQTNGVHCWFAPHKLYPNDFFYRRIDEAMRTYDKVLVLLSASSVWSERNTFQMERALGQEEQQQRQILFPLRIDETILQSPSWWATTLKKSHHLYDFTRWEQPDEYQQAFSHLLADLKEDKS